MLIGLRSVRTCCRLTIGALRLPVAVRRGRRIANRKLISIDVFETLVARTTFHAAAWQAGAARVVEVAREAGLEARQDAESLRRRVEQRLSNDAILDGRDPEFSHELAIREMLNDLGAGAWQQSAACEIAKWELDRERQITRPVAQTAAWVRRWTASGARVVAVSDTRYTGQEVAQLLEWHGIFGISHIYASADHGASKFSGKLFDIVAAREGADLHDLVHIGDSLSSDHLAAAQRGLAVLPVQALAMESVSLE